MSDLELWSKVTPEQQKIAYDIYKKWQAVAKSTERIDYQKATDSLKAVYFSIGLKKAPEILFFDSPEAVIKVVRGRDKYKQQYPFYFF